MLSHEFKLIFIHVPRTGGTSVDTLFRGVHQGHRSASGYCALLGDDIWERYFKFSTVRNPWDQLVSWYFFHHKNALYQPQNIPGFRAWVRRGMCNHWEYRYKGTDPFCQKTFVSIDGEVAVNRILRFEDLDHEFSDLCRQLKLTMPKLPYVQMSVRRRDVEYYDEFTADIVRDRCAEDIQFFGYEFDDKPVSLATLCRAPCGQE